MAMMVLVRVVRAAQLEEIIYRKKPAADFCGSPVLMSREAPIGRVMCAGLCNRMANCTGFLLSKQDGQCFAYADDISAVCAATETGAQTWNRLYERTTVKPKKCDRKNYKKDC